LRHPLYKPDEKDLSQPVGRFLTRVETVIFLHETLSEVLQSLHQKNIKQKIVYFYVVDDNYKLKGIVSTRQLLLSEPNSKIADIMQEQIIKLKVNQTLDEALILFDRHPLLALPVVDHEDKLLGSIDVQIIAKEALETTDLENKTAIFQMIGLKLAEGKRLSLRTHYRLRMPWLLCNVFSGLVCAVISKFYDVVLAQYLLLAFFIPLVLTLSESTAMQSMTQSLQFLRRPYFSWSIAWIRGLREWMIIGLLAITSAALVSVLSLFWSKDWLPSMTIGIGILFSIFFSAAFGLLLPILLFRMKLDPKVASGPVVLMITDMLTTAIYLSLATWWLVH